MLYKKYPNTFNTQNALGLEPLLFFYTTITGILIFISIWVVYKYLSSSIYTL